MPAVEIMPHVNASLNAISGVLLVTGFFLIKQGKVNAHKWTMLSCFGVSIIFLACYLFYHLVLLEGISRKFPTDAGNVRYLYYFILLTHVVLAAAVPVLAIITIYLGLRDRRAAHRRIAQWTFPIWLYVSITGVIVYFMLYHLYQPQPIGMLL